VWRERRHYAAVRSRRDSSANPSIQNPTDGLAKLEKELDQKAVINPMFLGEVIDSFREKEIPIAQYSNRIVSLTRHIHGKNIHEYCVLLGALEDADLHVVAQSVHEKLRAHMLVDKSIQPSERYYELAPNLVKHQGKRKVLKLYEELRNNKVRDPVNGDYAPIPPTIYILNAFIWACGGQTEEDVKDAFKLFDDIKRDGLHPDAASFSALISVLGNVNLEKASQQREEQQQKQQQQGGEEGEGDEDYSARVDKAVELMGTMFKTHGVRPTSMVYNALFTCYENILVEELLIQARQRKGSARVPFLFVNDYLRDEREEVLDEMFDILEKIIRSTKPVLAQPKERAFQILLRCAVKLVRNTPYLPAPFCLNPILST